MNDFDPKNKRQPISLRLEEGGLQPAHIGGVAELTSALGQYAARKDHRRTLFRITAELLDLRNDMAKRGAC